MKAMASPACASLGLLVLLCFSLCSAQSRLLESAGLELLTPQDPLDRWRYVKNSEPLPPKSHLANANEELGYVKNSEPLPPDSHLANANQELGLPGLVPSGSDLANIDQELGLASLMPPVSDSDPELGLPGLILPDNDPDLGLGLPELSL